MRLSTKVLKSGQFKFQPDLIVCDTLLPPSCVNFAAGEDLDHIDPQMMPEELEQQLKEWKELAWQQGRQEGYLTGLQAGRREAKEELAGQILAAKNLLHTVLEKRESFMLTAEQEMVDLAVKIAERVIAREVALEPGLILRTVRKAVRSINQREGMTLRVCPQDLPQLTEANLADVGISNFKLVEDPGLKPGDCILDSTEGRVDATLSSQLATITDSLGVSAGG